MQKGKWLSEKALQIAEKRREAKGKGEKEDIPKLLVYPFSKISNAITPKLKSSISPKPMLTKSMCVSRSVVSDSLRFHGL